MPFFGEYEYVTAQNGPVWILGSAIFYDYVVQYAAWADEKTYCFFLLILETTSPCEVGICHVTYEVFCNSKQLNMTECFFVR